MTEFSEADVGAFEDAYEDEEEGGAAFRDFMLEELNRLSSELESQRDELAGIRQEMEG